ncbi:MAG: PAS domain S-box protein [Arcobacteraceae bacterium]|nr:PAS domain S-box protein [Arcobacteraceae bacterium]
MLIQEKERDLSRIDKKLFVYFGFLIFALLVTIFLTTLFYFNFIIQKEQDRLGSIIANSVGNSINRVSFSGKYQARLLVQDLQKQNQNIDSIIIQDESGLIIAHSSPSYAGQILNDKLFEEAKKVMQTDKYIIRSITLIRDKKPIDLLEIDIPYKTGYENKISGVSRVFLSEESLNQLIFNAFITLTILTTILALIAYFAVKFLSKKISAPIIEQKEFFEHLLHIIPSPVFYKGIDGKYIGFNHAYENFIGKTREELLGKSVFDINPPELAKIYYAKDTELFEKNSVQVYESIVQDTYGNIHNVIFNKASIVDANGKINGIIGVILDITEQKEKEKELNVLINQQEALLKIETTGFVHLKDRHFLWTNEVFETMLGYEKGELQGKLSKIMYAFEEEYFAYEKDGYVALQTKGTFTREVTAIKKDGTHITLLASMTALNETGESLGVVVDITPQKIMEEELRKEKHFISTIVDNANSIIAVIDNSGVMTKINKYGEEFTQYSQDEIRSEPYFWKRFLPLEMQDKVVDIIENANKGILTKSFRNGWISKSGEEKFFEWSNTLVQNSNGTMDYLVAIGLDITEQVKKDLLIQQKKDEFETIFNSSKDGIAILDLNSKFLDFNKEYLQMTGFTREELLQTSCITLSSKEDIPRSKEIIQKVMQDGFVRNYEKTCIVKDGKSIIVNMAIALMPDKKRLLINTKDVSKQHKQKEELNKAKESAEKANKAKSEFLANMSHEIRTPLNGIIGLTELVLETNLNIVQRDYLEVSKKSSKALLNIINDILDYSKIEAGKLDIVNNEFNINSLMRNIADLFGYQTYEKSIELLFLIDHTIPNMLIGDALRLAQILNNLVGNAVKFTDKGYINIKVNLLTRDTNKVQLQFIIEDSGIGISPENQKKLFQSFEQADNSTTRKYGGTGLGLKISKQLVELMGGNISMESEEGIGTTFTFNLTLGFITRVETEKLNFDKFVKSQFLIVDDNELERDYLSRILNSWQIQNKVACDGEEAFEILLKEQFDYVLLDWQMPKLDGLELLKKLKVANIEIPNIVMVTAYAKEKLLENAYIHNLDLHKVLEKPYTPSSLYEVIFDEYLHHDIFNNNLPKELHHFRLKGIKNALLVEDNETNQLVATKILEKIGFIVTIACNGEDAIEKFNQQLFDIIFMDLQMPVMDGFEASKEIRKLNQSIPIVALSAAVMQRDKELTLEAGMNDHISKPIDKIELNLIVSKYFETEDIQEVTKFHNDLVVIEGIDIESLFNDLQTDVQTIYTTYEKFNQKYQDTLSIFNLPYDGVEFKEYIHKLKGVSGNLRIKKVYILANKINARDFTHNDVEQLKRELEKVCRDIETIISPLVEHQTMEPISSSQLDNMIQKVILDVEEYNYIAQGEIELFLDTLRTNGIKDETIDLLKDSFSTLKREKLKQLLNTLLHRGKEEE